MLKMNDNFKLSTQRCLIRFFQESDLEEFMLYRNDLQWMKYQEFKGRTYNEYKKILLNEVNVETGIQLAVIEKQTQKIIGDLYLQKEHENYWIGYTIAPWKAKQGYAYEIVSSFLKFLCQNGVSQVMASVDRQNQASIHLLKRLGFIKLEKEKYIIIL